MNNFQQATGNPGVSRSGPPRIVHHPPEARTQTRLDDTSPVLEINRSPRMRNGSRVSISQHTGGNDYSTAGSRPQICQPRNIIRQRQPSFTNGSRRGDNAIHGPSGTIDRNFGEVAVDERSGPTTDGTRGAQPFIQHGGLAEERRDRPAPAAKSISGPVPPLALQWVRQDELDPAQNATRQQPTLEEKDLQKRLLQQLKEKGDTCMCCSLAKKGCDLKHPCSNCERRQTFCFRNVEQLWLWKGTQQASLHIGSRHEALSRARTTAFEDTRTRLKKFLDLDHDLDDDKLPMLCLTSKPDNLSACSRIAVTSRHLARLLKSTPDSLRKDVNAALSDHIPDTVLPSLSSVQSVEERRLLASAQSALRIHTFLMNADGIKWHASTRSTWSARAIGCFFLECCARILPREIEDLLQMIRKSVRKYKDPGSVTQHSFAIYYRILTDLRQWTKTRSALDSIMEPLIARAHEVLDDLGSLYQTKYRSSTTLEGFAQESIPPTPNNITLHFSHELLTPNDNTAKPWDPSSNDPFRKDFWIFLPTLLVLDGKYSWISTTQFAALGAPSSKKIPITNVGTFETETSESDPSQLPNSSQDLTLVDSPWDDRSTYVQSPGDLRQLVEASDDHQVEHGDVKTPRELYWMHTEDTAGPLKRNLSPVSSESSRRSPVPKRSELDGWQSGNQFEEIYFEIMASRQSPSP